MTSEQLDMKISALQKKKKELQNKERAKKKKELQKEKAKQEQRIAHNNAILADLLRLCYANKSDFEILEGFKKIALQNGVATQAQLDKFVFCDE